MMVMRGEYDAVECVCKFEQKYGLFKVSAGENKLCIAVIDIVARDITVPLRYTPVPG